MTRGTDLLIQISNIYWTQEQDCNVDLFVVHVTAVSTVRFPSSPRAPWLTVLCHIRTAEPSFLSNVSGV